MQNDDVLKIKDLAALLKVGVKTIYSMAQSGSCLDLRSVGNGGLPKKILMSGLNNRKQALRATVVSNGPMCTDLSAEAKQWVKQFKSKKP